MAVMTTGAMSAPTLRCQDGRIGDGFRRTRSSESRPRLRLRPNSVVKLIDTIRALFGIVGLFVGAYAYSPPVMAEGEEVSGQDESPYGPIPAMLRGVVNYTIDIGNDDADELSIVDYYHMNNIHIPATVWSMDVNTVDQLGRIPGEPDAAIYADFGRRLESNQFGARLERAGFWSRTALGLWSDSAINHPANSLTPPALFQVASCGGSSAEHSDLEFCSEVDVNTNNELSDDSKNNKQVSDYSSIQSTNSSSTNSSNNFSQPSSAPNTPIAPSSITLFNTESPENLIAAYAPDASTPPIETGSSGDGSASFGDGLGPFGDSSGSSGDGSGSSSDGSGSSGDGSGSSGDGSGSSGDGPTYPVLGSGEGDSGAGSGQRPIPEAPTWVMTALGFGIVAFLFRRKRNILADSISIVDNT
jgi:hypothetical protein